MFESDLPKGRVVALLNKQTGNMYLFADWTWNPIRGRCPFGCKYCFMKRIWHLMEVQGASLDMRLEREVLMDDLTDKGVIFVGSSTDMWHNLVRWEGIEAVLTACRSRPENVYLFQSKNPGRFRMFHEVLPPSTILGTTLETNRLMTDISEAPPPRERAKNLATINWKTKMVSIEPIMDFDEDVFLEWLKAIRPNFISIGADSQKSGLPEPSADKVERLIAGCKAFSKVHLKDNLRRILDGDRKERNLFDALSGVLPTITLQ
jgi:DNA repair photolyase